MSKNRIKGKKHIRERLREGMSGMYCPVNFKETAIMSLTTEKKASIIGQIIAQLRFAATEQKKAFDEGDTFLSLCFKSDEELLTIAKLAGC